jgi:quercetin dioxygenase-like cupin family protein
MLFVAGGRLGKPSLHDVGGLSGPLSSGNMTLDQMLEVDDIRISAAVFQPGAHTWWHKHSIGQVFLVERGRGVVATREGAQILRAGDVLHTPAGEEHWHGAAPDSVFIYTVISLGTTDFVDEETSEAEYAAVWA